MNTPAAQITPRVPCCPKCGSADISADAAARWCVETQEWEVSDVYDKYKTCDNCGEEFSDPEWRDAGKETIHPQGEPS